MSSQKNSTKSKRNIYRHRNTKSTADIAYYGPPLILQPVIHASLGYNIKKTPLGLRKKTKEILFQNPQREQSNAYLAMKVGEINLFKRFRKLNYLQSWKSKKPIYNICEESTISKLHQDIRKAALERGSFSHIKASSFYQT